MNVPVIRVAEAAPRWILMGKNNFPLNVVLRPVFSHSLHYDPIAYDKTADIVIRFKGCPVRKFNIAVRKSFKVGLGVIHLPKVLPPCLKLLKLKLYIALPSNWVEC